MVEWGMAIDDDQGPGRENGKDSGFALFVRLAYSLLGIEAMVRAVRVLLGKPGT